MTSFDQAEMRLKLIEHLTNLDLWTAALPDDASQAQIDTARTTAEDFAEMIVESLSLQIHDEVEPGTYAASLKILGDDDLEEWIISYASQPEVAASLDE